MDSHRICFCFPLVYQHTPYVCILSYCHCMCVYECMHVCMAVFACTCVCVGGGWWGRGGEGGRWEGVK